MFKTHAGGPPAGICPGQRVRAIISGQDREVIFEGWILGEVERVAVRVPGSAFLTIKRTHELAPVS